MLKCALLVCESYLQQNEGRSRFQTGLIYQIRAHPDFSMAKATSLAPSDENKMRDILEMLLEQDDNITARAVARLHPTIRSASSITRSETRSAVLAEYQCRQKDYRRWRGSVGKQSRVQVAATIADKDIRIADLESQVELLAASHLAMLRVVGELGGFGKWAAFYYQSREARQRLERLGATPSFPAVDSSIISVST
jgi:hypothetical protein